MVGRAEVLRVGRRRLLDTGWLTGPRGVGGGRNAESSRPTRPVAGDVGPGEQAGY